MAAQCHCGRPLGHTGRHVGSPAKKADTSKPAKATRRTAKDKLLAMIEGQIEAGVQSIGALRGKIRAIERELRTKESELAPLRAFAESYRHPRIEGPARPVAVPEPPSASAQDYEPIAADIDFVTGWAREQRIGFASWDDLPRVNTIREELHLPTFKRLFRSSKVA